MNLTSLLVTVVIAGSATPGIAKMALQPVIAQKRATNFGIAEMQAVTFAARNEGKMSLTKTPDQCKLQEIGEYAFAITCWEGKRKYKMTATRSFRQGTSSEGTHAMASTQSSEEGTSSDEKYYANTNQSSGERASSDEKYHTNTTQSSEDRTSSDEKYYTKTNQSSRERTSSDEKYKTTTTQYPREGASNDEKYHM